MKVALTGAATGIGAAVVRKLNVGGHDVTAFDIQEPAEPVAQWVRTDLGDTGSIDAAVAAVTGPFDALINNAGLPPREGLEQTILAVNYFGLTRFLDGMLDKMAPGGAIVNTASRAGAAWRDNFDQVKALLALNPGELATFVTAQGIDPTRAYNLSKEAVIVMTMARAADMVARGLRMNSVSPAAVSTGILDDFKAAFGDKVARNIARAGRAGTPEEVADVIVFLASPQSHWVKGIDICIDGGMTAMAQADQLGLG